MNANTLLESLAKTWSHSEHIKFNQQPFFSYNPKKHIITYPDFYSEHIDSHLVGVSRWRWWRWNAFHEAMHVRHTPVDAMKFVTLEAKKHRYDKQFYHFLVNLYEDLRVNDTSMTDYIGMVDEYNWARDMTWHTTRYDLTNIKNRWLDLMYKLMHLIVLKRPIKLDVPTGTPKDFRDSLQFASDAYDKIVLNMKTKPPQKMQSLFVGSLEKIRFSRSMPDIYMASDVILDEYNKIIEDKGPIDLPGKLGSLDKLTYTMPHHRDGDSFKITEDTQPIIDALVRKLQYIKRGFVEIRSDVGEFETEDFIQGEELFFTDEDHIQGISNEIFLLLDFSASVAKMRVPYAKALYITFCAMEDLMLNVRPFIMSPPNFYYTHMDREALAEQLAFIRPKGGTPLSDAIEVAQELSRRKTRMIIITDGYPADPDRCAKTIRGALSHGMDISILAINTDRGAELFQIVGADNTRIKFVDTIEEIPEAVFSLLLLEEK